MARERRERHRRRRARALIELLQQRDDARDGVPLDELLGGLVVTEPGRGAGAEVAVHGHGGLLT